MTSETVGRALALPVVLRADDERLKTAETVLNEMAGSADKGISEGLFAKAKCVVIIPGVRRAPSASAASTGAATSLAGRMGKRVVGPRRDSHRGRQHWPAARRVRHGRHHARHERSRRRSDAVEQVHGWCGAAVAAGPVGRQATAQTDATMMAEILAWSRARGVFAGISLKGSTLREDTGENKTLYGKEITQQGDRQGRHAGRRRRPKADRRAREVLTPRRDYLTSSSSMSKTSMPLGMAAVGVVAVGKRSPGSRSGASRP